MTEAAHVPAVDEGAEPVAKRSLRERLFGKRVRPVSFPELVWAHFERQKALQAQGGPGGVAEERYRRYLDAFEAAHGKIAEVYWCANQPAAVALTVTRPPVLLRPFKHDLVRLHRVSDWLTKNTPDVARFMHDCDTLAVKIGSVLRETTQRIALQWTYALTSYLLAAVDNAGGRLSGAQLAAVTRAHRLEFARIEEYYKGAAIRGAQIVYFWGMVLGAVFLTVLGGVLLLVAVGVDADRDSVEKFFACYAAGAVGAIVSVLQRVTSGHFGIDYELGKGALRRLGSFRPFIGAVFGVAVFFVVKSEVVQVSEPETPKGFYFVVILAFLAGFSERFAKDLLDEAASIGSDAPPNPEAAPAASMPRPTTIPAEIPVVVEEVRPEEEELVPEEAGSEEPLAVSEETRPRDA